MTNGNDEEPQRKSDVDATRKYNRYPMTVGVSILLGILFFFGFFAVLVTAFANEDDGPFVFLLAISFGFASIVCFGIALLFSLLSGKVIIGLVSAVFLIVIIYFQICILAPAIRTLGNSNDVQERTMSKPDLDK